MQLSRGRVFAAAGLLRLVLLVYGVHHDAHSIVKYTDIDYVVFTDAARYIANGESPYARETYRYTPLLAWILTPCFYYDRIWLGKVLFAAADLLAGWLMVEILQRAGRCTAEQAIKYASVWLLNPMVAVISTRGNSESLIGVLVLMAVCLVTVSKPFAAGVFLGLAVHCKIYPFIYSPTLYLYVTGGKLRLVHTNGAWLFLGSVMGFVVPSLLMYKIYGFEFWQHTYLHHASRIDHRHNFSIYHLLMYFSSARSDVLLFPSPATTAFIPQLTLAFLAFPLRFASRHLLTTLFLQTFAFVSFNKVCTSQYFMWYLLLLPLYMPFAHFRHRSTMMALGLWAAGQAAWLKYGYDFEFLGVSCFYPYMWLASVAFFLINAAITAAIVDNI